MKNIKFEYRITLAYLFLGGVWIIFSDKLLHLIIVNANLLTEIQTYKGWFFVFVTALIFYIFLKKHLNLLRYTEQDLIRSQEKLNLALKGGEIGVWEWDFTTDITVWDAKMESLFGLEKGEFKQTYEAFKECLHPDDVDSASNAIKNAIEGTANYDTIYRVVWKNKEIKFIRAKALIVKDTNGNPAKMIGICNDITKRKQIESELLKAKIQTEESERKLIEAQKLAQVGSWEYIINTDIVTWSKEIFNIFERSYDLPAPNYTEQRLFYTKESFSLLDKAVQDCVQRGIPYELELDIIISDGSKKQIISKGNVLKNKNNKIIGCYGTAQDITEKKKNEREIIAAKEKAQESEARFKVLHNASFGGIAIHNKGLILDCNQGLSEISGFNTEELIGMNGLLLIAEESRDLVKKNILSNYEAPYEAIGLKKNGEKYPIRIEGRMIPYKGEIVRVVEFRDITSSKKNEQELIISKEKAEESDKLKSAFLANMSHEIRTPMNGILGFSSLLKNPELSGEKQQKYIEIIEKSGVRMLNIINDIVDISKIEAGLMKVEKVDSNINEQIDYIYTFFNPEAEAKGIQLSFKSTLTAKEALIKTDKEKLFAILTNLVKNAIKYTEKGSIEFGCEKKGDYLSFFIKDTGIGIPKERQKAIFERFIQADIKDKMARQGAGLGLSITKAYIEMLGGKIWVESIEGSGSTFYFTLPCNVELKEKNSTKEIEVTKNTQNNSINLKILIAEDDEVSEILISTYVSEFSNNIVKATTGIEAIEICQNNPDIDLILMDIQMPEMNGYDATKKIRQFNKNVIIIAQTAYGLSGDMEKSLDAGCNDYITKPINKTELVSLIQKYFTLRQS